jgi:hypothetical protein
MKLVLKCLMLVAGCAIVGSAASADDKDAPMSKASGRGAMQLVVVNAAPVKVEVRINNAVGGTTNFQFLSGPGHFEPVPLAHGLGDRVVSVRAITPNGTIVLPSRVLAVSKFDPSDATQPVLVLTFIRGVAGDEIVYTTGARVGTLGDAPSGKTSLSGEQRRVVEDVLKLPALKGGGN